MPDRRGERVQVDAAAATRAAEQVAEERRVRPGAALVGGDARKVE
jgi:hypothetical protein